MKRTRKLRVVIYLRISLDRDDQQSTGNQKRESVDYANHKGWEVVEVYTDLGKSGYKRGVKRPGFDQAMNMVKTKQADVFLVRKVSRFTRRIREFHMFLNDLIAAGGQFDSVTDPVDYMTASGELLLAMTAGFAQMESAAKADFAKSWNDGRIAKGACPQGPRPFGYDRIPRDEASRDEKGNLITLIPNPVESEIVRFAAEWMLSGQSVKSLMRELKGLDGSRKAPITATGIRGVLTSPTTAGLRAIKELDDNGKPTIVTDYVDGCWQPILDRDTWEACCTLLADPNRNTAESNQVSHLLTGILTCGKDGCGSKLGARKWKQNAGTNSNGTPRKQYENYRYCCFNCYNSAPELTIDRTVQARLLHLVPQSKWKALKEQGRGYDSAVVEGIKAEQRKLADMWKAGDLPDLDTFQMMNSTLVTRLAQATGAEPLDLPDIDNLAEGWDSLPVLDKRRILNVVFGQIKLDPANGTRDTESRLFLRRAI